MRFIADLHIHSHFSRATSRELVPERLALWAQKKGIQLLGTGDFTHPGWVSELQESLLEAEQGLFRLRPDLEKVVEKDVPPLCRSAPRFILSGEVSCIYKKDGRTRKLHHLILMPDFESLARFNRSLGRIGNIKSDGRPILGLDSRNLLETVLEASDRAFFVPAHIWTPWFSLFGSKSGFDAIEECFGDLTPHIHALETGLSSDPAMNGLFSGLDRYLLVSNSDAHSPAKLGREANLFDTELGYDRVVGAMSGGSGFLGTIEFFPEEGKYHLDGHRKCGVCLEPGETNRCGALCPRCGKPLTVGVLNRVHELADRDVPLLRREFFSLIPLTEILSEILSCGPSAARVLSVYEDLLGRLGPELPVLLDCPFERLEETGGPLLAEAVRRMRLTQVIRESGYDGEYGVIRLFRDDEKSRLSGQFGLFRPGGKSLSPGRPREKKPVGERNNPEKRPLRPRPSVSDPVLDPLNPEQRQAVLHGGGHLLIVAGPGTGKTMTLTHRIAHLVRSGIDPRQVLALTFTNKAAGEMKERIGRLVSGEEQGTVRVCTFHRFCTDVLREEGYRLGIPRNFILCSEWDGHRLAEEAFSRLGLNKALRGSFLRGLPLLKRDWVLDPAGEREGSSVEFLPPFQVYQRLLRDSGMLDLDDLEAETLRLFKAHPDVAGSYATRFPWVFVDEYQDTNPVETGILKTLIVPEPSRPCTARICAIGDPDQAIYGFRGAEVQNFFTFEKDFPGAAVVRLVRNYRSTQVILNGAASLLKKEGPLQGQNGQGGLICMAPCRTAAEEAEMVVAETERLMGGTSHFSLDSGRAASGEGEEGFGFGDVAVLFRLNRQGEPLEEAFQRSGIPYTRSGEIPLVMRHPVHRLWRFLLAAYFPDVPHYREFYLSLPEVKRREGESILKTFPLTGSVAEAVERAVSVHALDSPGEEAQENVRRLRELAAGSQGGMKGFLDRLSLDRGIDHAIPAGDRVSLMSLHAAKGLEWPIVFITGCEERLLPCTLFWEGDEEEERRLFYVGMTRARKWLVLSHTKSRRLNGQSLGMNPSPFLDLIPQDLYAPLDRKGWKPRKSKREQLALFD